MAAFVRRALFKIATKEADSSCSDQLITLTTVIPSKLVRITGITPEYGLLRTIPERTGWSSGDGSFIDLQPDGNSFDLMAGLIKSKSSS